MGKQVFEFRTNPMQITSLFAFANVNGGCVNGKRDVYFLRYVGFESEKSYLAQIWEMDRKLGAEAAAGHSAYLRILGLDKAISPEEAVVYAAAYQRWSEDSAQETGASSCALPDINYEFAEPLFADTAGDAFKEALRLYRQSNSGVSDSMVRNFAAKTLYWMDRYLPQLFAAGKRGRHSAKFVVSGKVTLQEYLFLYALVRLGCDVLYLAADGDIALPDSLLDLSARWAAGSCGKIEIPAYAPVSEEKERPPALAQSASGVSDESQGVSADGIIDCAGPVRIDRNRFVRPDRQKSAAAGNAPAKTAASRPQTRQPEQILDYEELARLSTSVVMISVFDENGKCIKTGSGVMISEKGYILTNFHVAAGGASYGIRFEEEEQAYETRELVKYNQVHDLAIIKIDKRCAPIPVFRGEKQLARGQKVVAIGSPLGLFNSVSDGIISGFRTFGDMSMIQFTAPTSHGSSGGALLDLQGRLIGIITAGFDDAQNINLAVEYATLRAFAGGFLP